MPNHWEAVGVVYLTLPWQESDYQVSFLTFHLYLPPFRLFSKGERM